MLAELLAIATLTPATFAPAPGWHVGVGRVHTCSGSGVVECRYVNSFAATVPWSDCAECLPHRTVARLRADGIALQLQVGVERDPPKWMRPLRWPPRIRVVSSLEGLPGRIGVFQKIGFVHGWSASLFIFFGRPTPTAHQVALARKELATVSFPRRP
jgi:hypothetical protein